VLALPTLGCGKVVQKNKAQYYSRNSDGTFSKIGFSVWLCLSANFVSVGSANT